MAKIILIQGIHITKEGIGTVEDMLGTSNLFKKSLMYAKKQKADDILILSPFHHILKLTDIIEKVDKSFDSMTAQEKRNWANKTAHKLEEIYDLENDTFIFLAGEEYYKNLLPYMKNFELPLEGMRIGERLHWLNDRI